MLDDVDGLLVVRLTVLTPTSGLCPVLRLHYVVMTCWPQCSTMHAPSGLLCRICIPLLGAAAAEPFVVIGVRLIIVLIVIIVAPVNLNKSDSVLYASVALLLSPSITCCAAEHT